MNICTLWDVERRLVNVVPNMLLHQEVIFNLDRFRFGKVEGV